MLINLERHIEIAADEIVRLCADPLRSDYEKRLTIAAFIETEFARKDKRIAELEGRVYALNCAIELCINPRALTEAERKQGEAVLKARGELPSPPKESEKG